MPFALNVLTLRGDKISDVDAFITRTHRGPRPRGDRAHARAALRPGPGPRLAFERLGLPERLN